MEPKSTGLGAYLRKMLRTHGWSYKNENGDWGAFEASVWNTPEDDTPLKPDTVDETSTESLPKPTRRRATTSEEVNDDVRRKLDRELRLAEERKKQYNAKLKALRKREKEVEALAEELRKHVEKAGHFERSAELIAEAMMKDSVDSVDSVDALDGVVVERP